MKAGASVNILCGGAVPAVAAAAAAAAPAGGWDARARQQDTLEHMLRVGAPAQLWLEVRAQRPSVDPRQRRPRSC